MTDINELASYAAKRKNSELLEDVSHLKDLDIVVAAISVTENGSHNRLSLKTLDILSTAFTIYRDEFLARCSDSDKPQETSYSLLKSYYECVKTIRTLNKYLNRYAPISEVDYTGNYDKLSENRKAIAYTSEVATD